MTQAIDSARETGDKRSKGIQLGNLGDILVQQNRLEEAENVFRKAIPICDEAYPFAAGAFRGSLALLLAQKGQRGEALELLKVGEVQLLKLPAEYAKLLCKKGQIQMMFGEWADLMVATIDSTNTLWTALYFVSFMVIVGLIFVNLFIV